jgi:hypothetical protein
MDQTMVTTTRSGRQVKKPERYEPDEKVLDDYSDDDSDFYSSDDEEDLRSKAVKTLVKMKKNTPEVESDGETLGSDSEESDDEDNSDADEQGNLKDFVVYSDSEDE